MIKIGKHYIARLIVTFALRTPSSS